MSKRRQVPPSSATPMLERLQQQLSFSGQTRPAGAAVLLALTDEDDPKLLLTRRARHLNSHAGEVSLPGGKRDPADTSNIVVALREAQEETGLDPFSVRLLGELPMQRARSGLRVQPIVGIIPAQPVLQAQPAEIDRLFFVSIRQMLCQQPQPYAVKLNGRQWYVPSYQLEQEVIWGLTGRIVVSLLQQGLGQRVDWPLLMRRSRLWW